MENDAKTSAPYVPFRTFLNSLDSLASFMPDQIDSSLWRSFSGGIKSQLIATLKFMSLISGDGTTTSELRELANNSDKRPELLKGILGASYAPIFASDLKKATPAGFDALFRGAYKIEGATLRKAESFFLQAARYAGIELSPLLTGKGSLRPAAVRKRNGTVRQRTEAPGVHQNENPAAVPNAGPSKIVSLKSGGELTLAATVDSFKMSKSDRDFVFKLLGEIEDYEARGHESKLQAKGSTA